MSNNGNGATPPTNEPGVVAFTLPHSKRQVFIKRVSPFLARDVQRAFKPPDPPLNEVANADGTTRLEPNPIDPDYEAALKQYQTEVNEKTMRLAIALGVVFRPTEAQEQEIAELRQSLRDILGIELPVNDRDAYMTYIVLTDPRDAKALMEAIFSRSIPTEEKIAEAAETFRRSV